MMVSAKINLYFREKMLIKIITMVEIKNNQYKEIRHANASVYIKYPSWNFFTIRTTRLKHLNVHV